jgi:hypothetical protein
MAIGGVDKIFENWRIITSIYAVGIGCSSIAAFFILKEDPIFLFDRGEVEKAKQVLR